MKMPFLKKFFKENIWSVKGVFFIALLCGLLASGLKALMPQLLNYLIDSVWTKDSYSLKISISICFGFFAIWLVSGVFRFLNTYILRTLFEAAMIKIKKDFFNKCIDMGSDHNKSNVPSGIGGLLSQYLNDTLVASGGMTNLPTVFREPFLILFSLAYIIYLDWVLTLGVLITFPVIQILLKNLHKKLKEQSTTVQIYQGRLTEHFKESIEGLTVVQSFNLQDEFKKRLSTMSDKFLEYQKKIFRKELALSPVSDSIVALGVSGALMYIGHAIVNEKLSFADFSAFLFAMGLLQDSLKRLQGVIILLPKTEVALERLYQVISQDTSQSLQEGAQEFPSNWSQIKFCNLSYQYSNKKSKALEGLNFTIKKNQTVAILGRSGSGKSTLIKIFQKFLPIQGGDIFFDDTSLKKINSSKVREQMGLVEQDAFLFSKTIKENIYYGDIKKAFLSSPDELDEQVKLAAQRAETHSFISELPDRYDSFLGDKSSQLSGGQRQRLTIARAFFKNAPILILDEPTSALDKETQRDIQKNLLELAQNKTSIIITHNFDLAYQADWVFVFSEGKIKNQGAPQDVLKNLDHDNL